MFIAFLAMLMGPTIASSVTLAQDDLATEEAPQELLPLEETVETLPEETVPPEPETATLTITKGVCDTPGFDPYLATTEQELADNCTAPPINADFTVSDGLGFSSAQSGTQVVFEVPAGTLTISETVPDGYGEPVASCVSTLLGSAGLISISGGAATVSIDPGDDFSCTWYNVPQPTDAELTINKYRCPEGYDVADPASVPENNCTEPMDGVTFTVADEDPATTDLQSDTGDSVPGAVVFGGLLAGDYTVTETLPDGIASAFIWNCDVKGGHNEIRETPLSVDTELKLRLSAGMDITCNWFNVPGEDESLVPPTEPTEGGEVTFTKYYCGESVDASADWPVLAEQCTDSGPAVDLTLTVPTAGYQETASTGVEVPPGAVFSDVPYGQLFIEETVPDGYLWPRVFCTDVLSDGMGDFEELIAGAESEAGAFTWDHDAEADPLRCIVFNIPAGGPSDLIVYKWTCPDGYDPYADGANPFAECTAGPDGVTFTLTDNDPSTADIQSDTGDSIKAGVMFGGLEPGPYTITETVPEAIDSVYLWGCYAAVQGLDVLPAQAGPISEGNTFEYLAEGTSSTCHMLNVPGRETTVVIHKWFCPEGAGGDDLSWYEGNCTETREGTEFQLYHEDGWTLGYTDGSGTVEWNDVPTGPIAIQEYVPADYGTPFVVCNVNGGDWDFYPAETGYIEHPEFGQSGDEGDYTFTCNWYNVPGGPSEITIFKYTCPAGYDLYAEGANPEADCPEATNGIIFTLSDGATERYTETGENQNPNGGAYFADLQPGSYTITETVPADTAYVFVLDCYGQNQGELRPYPLSMGDTLHIDVSAGEVIECYWFNVPEDPDGRLTVVKHTCSTKVFVSTVDCEIEEGGQDFDLYAWDGDSWEYAASGTTDGVGRLGWTGLEPGAYWVDEPDTEWCHLTSDWLSDDGNWLDVNTNEETVVHVYNCTGQPGKPSKTPTKYPNTGVPPVREEWRLEP